MMSAGPFTTYGSDADLRIEALRQAVVASDRALDDAEDITAAAKKFYKFLSGKRS